MKLPLLAICLLPFGYQDEGSATALPAPTGSNSIGTVSFEWFDDARPDPVTGSGARAVLVQAWYPAKPTPERERAPYVSAELVEACKAERLFEQPAEVFEAWLRTATHAVEGAPAIDSILPLSVVLVSHGLGVPRALSTTLCEELASHGLVAVSIDHAYGGLAVLADGRVLSSSADPALEEGEEGFARRTSEWAADLTFVLDRLAKLPKSVPIARRLELQRVGAAGHSMGGAAAVLAACRDARIVACVDMDGAPFDLEELGLCKPTLVLKSAPIYSDAELEAAGRSPAEWKGMGDGIHALWRGLHEKGGGALAYASIRGTAHMSFCDAPFTMPATITAFGGTFLSAQRTYEVVGALVRAFLEQALAPDAKPFALRDPASLPEVELLLD